MNDSCVFCDIIQQRNLTGAMVYVIEPPLNPVTDGHVLFVPAEHITNAASFDPFVTGLVMQAAADYGKS